MNVIQLHAPSAARGTLAADDPGTAAIRRSIAKLNGTIKTMHELWQIAPNDAGLALIVRWQKLRDRLELLDLRAPEARAELESVRSQMATLNQDMASWCQTFCSQGAIP